MSENSKESSDRDDTVWIKSGIWMNEGKSGNSIIIDAGQEKLSAGKSLVEAMIAEEEEDVETVNFSEYVEGDGEDEGDFERRNVYITPSDSGKGINLSFYGHYFTAKREQVKRLLGGEIQGAPFFEVISKNTSNE